MTTTAKIRQSALDLYGAKANWDGGPVGCHFSDACAQCLDEVIDHILATVREDDERELTDGFMSDMGFVSAVDDQWSLGQITAEIGNGDSDVWLGDGAYRVCVKNRGQFRSLLAGLNIPLPATP